MKCPSCGLINPPEAIRCDCGYHFAKNIIDKPFQTNIPSANEVIVKDIKIRSQNTLKCPVCGLTNPPEAIRCDCGFNFKKETVKTLRPGQARARPRFKDMERNRIYEQEKMRLKARQKVRGQMMAKYSIGCLITFIVFVIFIAIIIPFGKENKPSVQKDSNYYSALDKMALAFKGNHTKKEIRRKFNHAFTLFNIQKTEENYERYGSVLVSLQNEFDYTTEMEILDYAIKSYSSDISIKLGEMMALSAVAIKYDN